MKNKIITSEGNVQFQYGDGSGVIINVHPFHVYTHFKDDTVSFILIAMPKSSGLSLFTSRAEDLEINGTTYSTSQLPDALSEAFAEAGAQARAEVVEVLPLTGKTNTIYLVPKAEGSGYDEYIYLKDENKWELLGDTDIELSRYIKKSDFNTYSAETKTVIDSKQDALIAGDNITINGNVISSTASGGGGNGGFKVITRTDASENTISGLVSTLSTDYDTETFGRGSVIEGTARYSQNLVYPIVASGIYSHAEGAGTSATTEYSHTEGFGTLASGKRGHAEGEYTVAKGDSSHAEGYMTSATTLFAHAEGNTTLASGRQTHAEGNFTIASGITSHAEGNHTKAGGNRSHAEGSGTTAIGESSHAEGVGTIANNTAEHASGQFNVSNTGSNDADKTLFSVGNGTAVYARHNAFEIRTNGDIYIIKNGVSIKLQDYISQLEARIQALENGN